LISISSRAAVVAVELLAAEHSGLIVSLRNMKFYQANEVNPSVMSTRAELLIEQ
jgi:hypothetical protein